MTPSPGPTSQPAFRVCNLAATVPVGSTMVTIDLLGPVNPFDQSPVPAGPLFELGAVPSSPVTISGKGTTLNFTAAMVVTDTFISAFDSVTGAGCFSNSGPPLGSNGSCQFPLGKTLQLWLNSLLYLDTSEVFTFGNIVFPLYNSVTFAIIGTTDVKLFKGTAGCMGTPSSTLTIGPTSVTGEDAGTPVGLCYDGVALSGSGTLTITPNITQFGYMAGGNPPYTETFTLQNGIGPPLLR